MNAELELEQFGEGWHMNRFTGELSPDDDEGWNRLYRLRPKETE